MTRQATLFDMPPDSADEIREGSPQEWVNRVNRGLCAKCGDPRGEPHPDADEAVNSHLKHKFCRTCFEADRVSLEGRMKNSKPTEKGNRHAQTHPPAPRPDQSVSPVALDLAPRTPPRVHHNRRPLRLDETQPS